MAQLREKLEGMTVMQETQRLLAAQRDDLSNQLSVQLSERDQLLDRIADLTQELENFKQKWDSEEADRMQRSGEEVSALRLKLFEVVSEKEQLTSSIESLEEELASFRSSSVELNSQLADLSMERQLLIEKCMELNETRTALEMAQHQLSQLQLQSPAAPSSELIELRTAVFNLTSERDELSIAQSEIGMELEETQARLQVMEQEIVMERQDWQRRLDDAGLRLAQQLERIDRVSVERDHLQQSISNQPPRNEENSVLVDKISALETELHETKIKAAKSLRQVKLLRAEKASAPPSGPTVQDSFFAAAAEEELRKQVSP